jgi:peptide chain release factor 1
MLQEQQAKIAAERRGQIGSGDRSEKIRTYNFPQDRITDHRIGLTVHDIPSRMSGAIDDVLQALNANDQAQRLREEIGA